MSTRCHIFFTDGEAQLLTYKHCDGYPEGAIPLLREFWHWYPRTKHLEYLTATWFYFCKRQYEERSKELDLWDDPMKMNELNTDHPVALSYGICADEEIHGNIEHFYEVDIEAETVTHYTPESWGFESADTPAEIIGREPERTYPLNLNDVGASASTTQSSSPESGITDGGETTNLDLSGGCAECGSDGEIAELCDECMREVAESLGGNDEDKRNESTEGDSR